MRCYLRNVNFRQSIKSLGLVLLAGGFFSSLRGETIVVTPSDFASKVGTAKPGDTVLLRGGSYAKISSVPSGTSWGGVVTIKAYPGEKVTVRKVGLSGAFQYIVFEDLFIDGEMSGSGGDETVYLSGANHIRFLRCDISRALIMGVLIPHVGSDYNEFIQTRIHHNAGSNLPGRKQHGVYASARYTLLDRCEIDNNGSYGVHFYNGYGERADGQIIRNSRVHDNGRDDPGAAGIILSSGSGSQAIGNDVFNNPRNIEVGWRNPANMVVRGNKIAAATLNEVLIQSDALNTVVEYNCVDPSKITNHGQNTIGLSTNSPTACGGSSSPPPPTNVDVTQTQPPPVPSSSQPSGPSTSQVAAPFLVLGVLGAALLFGD